MHPGFTKECWGAGRVRRTEVGVERRGQVLEALLGSVEFTLRTGKNH